MVVNESDVARRLGADVARKDDPEINSKDNLTINDEINLETDDKDKLTVGYQNAKESKQWWFVFKQLWLFSVALYFLHNFTNKHTKHYLLF